MKRNCQSADKHKTAHYTDKHETQLSVADKHKKAHYTDKHETQWAADKHKMAHYTDKRETQHVGQLISLKWHIRVL